MKQYERLCRAEATEVSVSAKPSSSRGAIPKQNVSVARTVANTVASAKPAASASDVDISTVRCYNCFDFGHYQSSCQKPKRTPNSCFICDEVGHTRHNCSKKKKPSDAQDVSAVAAAINDWNITEEEEEEVRRLAAKLAYKQNVSVAFYKQNECTELILRSALFDSGSPVSCVTKSWVPFIVNSDRILIPFRGMGNGQLSMYGLVKCKFVFREHNLTHYFLILPDELAAVPLLVGRDLLRKMNIHLCQLKTEYSTDKLLSLNKANEAQIPNETVVSQCCI